MRNETVAPRDAPSRLSDVAVGITPQEQSGSGMPNNAAQSTERKLLPASLSAYIRRGTNSLRIPATRNPNNRYGVISFSRSMSGVMYFSIYCIFASSTDDAKIELNFLKVSNHLLLKSSFLFHAFVMLDYLKVNHGLLVAHACSFFEGFLSRMAVM